MRIGVDHRARLRAPAPLAAKEPRRAVARWATRMRGRGLFGVDNGAVGFNPHRRHRRSPADIVFVVGALAISVGLLAWAVFG